MQRKININSPLVKIITPETIEKNIIFLWFFSFIIKIKNFKNRSEKITCKFIEEICPQ